MSENKGNGWRNWSDHPLIVLTMMMAALIAILSFLGIPNIKTIFTKSTSTALAEVSLSTTPADPSLQTTQTIPVEASGTASSVANSGHSIAQNVQWIPNREGIGGGLCIDWEQTRICPSDKIFIPWNTLKLELEQNLLPQVPEIPTGSSLILQAGSDGTPNNVIKVVDPSGVEKADVWIGNNPEDSWSYDGLIRIGDPATLAVWATFTRISDGTYLKK